VDRAIGDATAATPRIDLPLQPRPIIGRGRELAVGQARLVRGDVRLLTLTGPPGVGKTRLALELAAGAADEFAGGAAFVDLAPIVDAELVIDAIARMLGLQDLDRRVAIEVVEEYLRGTSILLVLDNFEQVLAAAPVVGRLLAACPGLKVLATSRAPLHLTWEHELAVPPLELPALSSVGADSVASAPAGRLFVERAQSVAPGFVLGDADAAAVAEICVLLDGLPLAIELAAARIKLFPPRALLRRLRRVEHTGSASPLSLLADQTRDLPARQQTLLRAISWSYDLLDHAEQALLRRMSVFVGGCSIDAAEAVGVFGTQDGLDLVASLIDKSLVWQEEQADGEPRLHMLETIRAYAWDQLERSDELEAIRARHAAYFVELSEQATREFFGPRQQSWFGVLERERANLRVVESWANARRDQTVIVRLTAALWPFWLAREDAARARDRLDAFLALMVEVPSAPGLAQALHGTGLMAEKLGDYDTCRSLLEQSIDLARQQGDRRTLASVLDSLGRQEFIEGRYAAARPRLEESHALLRYSNDRVGLARVLSHLGFLDYLEGDLAAARSIFDQGMAVARAAHDEHRVAEFFDNLGRTSDADGDVEEAARMFEEAVAIWRRLGQGHWLAMALNDLGKVQVRRGRLDSARVYLLEELSLAHRIGNRRRMGYVVSAIATLAAAEGQPERAAVLQAAVDDAFTAMGAAFPARSRATAPPPMPQTAGTARLPAMTLDEAVEDSLQRLSTDDHSVVESLTRRERDVAALLAMGLSNRQIAEALVVTEGTAENYVQRLRGKLGFHNRAQIAVWAIHHGLAPQVMRPTPK